MLSLQIIHAELNSWAPKTSPIKRKKLFLLLSGWEMDDKLLSCRADKNLLNVDIFAYLEAWVDVSEGIPSELSFLPAEILKYDLLSPSHRKYWKLFIGKTKPLLFFPALWNSCIYLSHPSISAPATGKESKNLCWMNFDFVANIKDTIRDGGSNALTTTDTA